MPERIPGAKWRHIRVSQSAELRQNNYPSYLNICLAVLCFVVSKMTAIVFLVTDSSTVHSIFITSNIVVWAMLILYTQFLSGSNAKKINLNFTNYQ